MMKGRHYKKIVIISLVLSIPFLLSSSVNALTIQQSNENVITVDKNGDGDFTSIQNAIDHARSGSTIFINNGEYPEIIHIKKNIHLVGEDKDSTLINPVSEKNKYAIYVGASYVTLENIGVTNGAPGLYPSGIKIVSSYIKILNCKIFDTPVGIAVWTSGNNFEDCVFYRCKDEGIALLGSSINPCNNNVISNCIFYENCDGIELQHSSFNQILNCDIYDNTHTGIDAIASSNNENIISNCNIFNNKVNGIYLSSSNNNKIIDCTFENNIDGDIVMNKYSENNEILESIQSQQYNMLKTRITAFFQSLIEKINTLKTPRSLSF
jgi:parallel beta-helix repeat protein